MSWYCFFLRRICEWVTHKYENVEMEVLGRSEHAKTIRLTATVCWIEISLLHVGRSELSIRGKKFGRVTQH